MREYEWQGETNHGSLTKSVLGLVKIGVALAGDMDERKVSVRRDNAIAITRWLREAFGLTLPEVMDWGKVEPQPVFGELYTEGKLLETTLTQGAIIDYVDLLAPPERAQLVHRLLERPYLPPERLGPTRDDLREEMAL